MTLVEFLLQRIAEDEQAARLASDQISGPWSTRQGGPEHIRTVHGSAGSHSRSYGDDDHELWDSEGGYLAPHRDVAEHIARWDPARALAECASKRRIVAEHRDDGHGGCYGCGFGSDEERMNTVDECPTLRALASVYDDHADFAPSLAITETGED